MKTLDEVTNEMRELLSGSDVGDVEATAVRMGEALHEAGLSVATASPAQLTALLAESPDWTIEMIDGQRIR